jgi:spermidine/putrescine-binding protein
MLRRFVTSAIGCAALGLAALGLSAPAHAAGSINVFNWADYLGKTTLSDFEQQTGIKANLSYYDSDEMMDAKVMAGHTGYDVVVTGAEPFLAQEIKAGAYMTLDHSKIPNWGNQDPQLLKILETADPGNAHATIYQWGTIGLGYNPIMVKKFAPDAPTNSWGLLFNPVYAKELSKCGINIIDSASYMVPVALKYLGLNPDSQSPADLKKAGALLMAIRPYMKTISQETWLSDMAGGNLCLSVGWNGDVLTTANRAAAAHNGVVVNYVVPKEGSIIWFDTLAIPADAPNPAGALTFLNYMLEPKTIAQCGDYTNFANAVPAAKPFMTKTLVADTRVYPPEDVLQRVFLQTDVSPHYERLRTRVWSEFKNGS